MTTPSPVPAPVPSPVPRRRTGLIVGIVVGVLVVAAGAVGVGVLLSRIGSQLIGLPLPTASHQASAVPTPSKYTAPLQDLALPMPADATRVTPPVGAADGTLELEDVVQQHGAGQRDVLRQALTKIEFERGVFLAWKDGQGVLVYLQIYQFHFDRQAAAWSSVATRSLADVAESSAGFDEILGGRWGTLTAPDGRGYSYACYSRGDLSVAITVFTSGAAGIDHVKRLAVEQYKRLPAWS